MVTQPCFGLLTDFGFDFAVASMKAVLVQQHPHAQIIDIDHGIAKFNIVSGAFVIDKAYRYFPHGTVFICVIDPGVGSDREAICIETDKYTFFGPNNGLFHYIVQEVSYKLYEIDERIVQSKSYTFHGRDLFIPAASAYAQGKRNFLQLLPKDRLVSLPLDNDVIAYIDSFGNIKTTITVDAHFADTQRISITVQGNTYEVPFVKTFSDTKPGTLLCYKGSNETLEIAVDLGSAQQYLQAQVGDTISAQIV